MKEGELAITLIHLRGMYGNRVSLNSNIIFRLGNCQKVQKICDDKAVTATDHVDPDHQPTDKSVSAQNNYSTCRLARAHAATRRQAHFFLFIQISSEFIVTVCKMKGRTVNIRLPEQQWRLTILLENLSWTSRGTKQGLNYSLNLLLKLHVLIERMGVRDAVQY